MKREKNILKIEAIIQIVLLITAMFAFSYFIERIFDLSSGIGIVSAQGTSGTQTAGLTNEELTTLRQGLANYPGTNQELNNTLIDLERNGYLSRSDFTNAEIVSRAINDSYNDYNSDIDSGNTANTWHNPFSTLIQSFIGNAEISGGDIQLGLYDSTGGLKMCAQTKNGRLCQPFASNICNDNCKENCIDVELTTDVLPDDNECKLGLCYDSDEGSCESRSPKTACVENNGDWYKTGDATGEGLCRRGCCIINDQALFLTNKQCEKRSASLGFELGGDNAIFNSDINEEPACIAEAYNRRNANLDGACTFPHEDGGKLDCKFVKGDECSDIGGIFNAGKLCSNSELNTRCTKSNSTNCVEGLDEIYWIDSCGNRENIYEGSDQDKKDLSWFNGLVKAKNESCILSSGGNNIANQGTCGNCDRFRGSICSNKTMEPIVQKLNDDDQNFVCLDMGCYDDNGKRIREHGESWCAYQSKIGINGLLGEQNNNMVVTSLMNIAIPQIGGGILGGDRAVDTPGSSHFRATCLNGKIQTSACETGRREICVESRSEISGSDKEFSQAVCRKNRAMECFQYNPGKTESQAIGLAGPQKAWKILRTKLQLTCGLDPDCFVLDVNLASGKDDTFKFSYCAPRYKLGFDLENSESGKQFCSQASQKCTAVFVKGIGGWECKANCDCVEGSDPSSAKPSQKFVKEMGRFCSSLGDCGSQVSYTGKFPGGKGYSVTMGKDPLKQLLQFGSSFSFSDMLGMNSMLTIGDDIPRRGEYIPANDTKPGGMLEGGFNNFLKDQGILGIFSMIDSQLNNLMSQGGGGNYGVPDISGVGSQQSSLIAPGLVAGGAGGAMLGYGYLTSGLTAETTTIVTGTIVESGVAGETAATVAVTETTATSLAGFGGALFGAGIGAATVGFLIKMLGIGPGLSPGVAYAMMGTGAIGGAVVGYQAFTGGSAAIAANPIGVILFVAVIAILIIFKFMGVGEVEEVEVNFECKQWEPPRNVDASDCRSCGNDDLSDGQNSFPCNKYSCQALGQDCQFIEGSEIPGKGGICEYAPQSDTQAPLITGLREEILSENFEYDNVDLNGERIFEVRKTGEECLDQFESVTFGFNTNEYATKCAISGSPRENTDMMVALSSGLNHSYTFNSRNLDALGVVGLKEEERNDFQLYLVCQDIRGNNNIANEYIVKMCVIPRDLTPTLVLNGDELNDLLIANNARNKTVSINLNEPSECRWDYAEKTFDEMENNMQCNSNILQCSTLIPFEEDEKQICIKCRDHTEWQGNERENERNENTQCVDASLIRTNALEITSITPNNETIKKGASDSSIEIVVNTAGGANYGEADCYYDLDNSGRILFMETGNREEHKQNIGAGTSRLDEGNHNLKVSCQDNVGNKAEIETTFKLDIDMVAPKVARIYAQGNSLNLIVDESANCAFVNSKPTNSSICEFDVKKCSEINGCGEMSIDFTNENYTKFSAPFDIGKTYYIRCVDEYGNQPSQCNAKVIKGIFV